MKRSDVQKPDISRIKTEYRGLLCPFSRVCREEAFFYSALKKMNIYILIIAFVLMLIPFTSEAGDDEQKTVRVGYFENEIFQEGAGEGLVKTGYGYEYYRKISEYTGWEYEYVYGGFAELYQMLLDGEIDLLAGLAKTEERENIIGYPDMPMASDYRCVYHVDLDKDDAVCYRADPDDEEQSGEKNSPLDV